MSTNQELVNGSEAAEKLADRLETLEHTLLETEAENEILQENLFELAEYEEQKMAHSRHHKEKRDERSSAMFLATVTIVSLAVFGVAHCLRDMFRRN